MPQHTVKRGLDIPIKGAASGTPVDLGAPSSVAWSPQELRGIIPRVDAKPGTRVKAGQVVAHSKLRPRIKLLSPVSGTVREIRRGERRVITDIVIDREGEEAERFPTWAPSKLPEIGREEAIEALCAGGLWPVLRTRPLSNVADPDHTPQSILVHATETGPLMPGADVLLDPGDGEALQAGLHVLNALTDGPVFLTVRTGERHPALQGLQGVEVHGFSGPHPSGDPAVQINLVDPPRGSHEVWYAAAWDVVLIGKLFLEGRFPAERTYAVVGAGAKPPRIVRTVLGAPLADLVGETIDGPTRWIRGSVLTGEAVSPDRWASFYARGIHVLPAEISREVLGWTLPNLGKWSFHRAYLSGFFKPRRTYDLRPKLGGGRRAIVPVGVYRKVVATPDIDIPFLFRSIVAGDLEESIQLGMLDLSEEEAALCTYVCPSKIEFGELLRGGLQAYQKEM